MKTLYLDIFSGISGDMFIGALIDLGVDAGQLELELRKLPLEGYHLHVRRGHKSQIHGTKFEVHLAHEHEHQHGRHPEHEPEAHDHSPEEDAHEHEHSHADGVTHRHAHSHRHEHSHDHEAHDHAHEHDEHTDHHEHSHEAGEHEHEHHHQRNFAEIEQLILNSALSTWVKQKAVNVFRRIALAEGKVHDLPPEQVHFHEVGAVDSIVDIVGGCLALEMLGKPAVLASPVVEGTGWIRCAHGRMPVPAPATLEILGAAGVGLTQCEEPHELVTPTGAAMLTEFCQGFGPMRGLVAGKVGIGLGTRDNQTRPNVLRAILGNATAPAGAPAANDWETDFIAVLQTNLDDISSEVLGAFVELALAKGALDVFHTPIQMKKNRPGVLLSVLCATADADKFSELILRETTAFGVRRGEMERRKLKREFTTVKTAHGEVTVKLGLLNGERVQVAPEFESCKRLAAKTGVPLKAIYEAALRAD